MSRVVALIPDLLFGSRVVGGLIAAGHEVQLVGDESHARESLAGSGAEKARAAADTEDPQRGEVDVLVVDLTSDSFDGATALEGLSRAGLLRGVRTLAFYAHVDVEVRERAERAGFDLVVPRSRMAREGVGLVERLAAEAT
jgi:CheY-like chemotaxis protein